MASKDKTEPTAKARMVFGVLMQESGSYTMGEFRFLPYQITPASEEISKLACTETSPVRFFDSMEAAEEAVSKSRAKQPKG